MSTNFPVAVHIGSTWLDLRQVLFFSLPHGDKGWRIQIITKDFQEHWVTPWTLEKTRKMMNFLLEHSEGKLLVRTTVEEKGDTFKITFYVKDSEEGNFYRFASDFFFPRKYWRVDQRNIESITFSTQTEDDDTSSVTAKEKLLDRIRNPSAIEIEKQLAAKQPIQETAADVASLNKIPEPEEETLLSLAELPTLPQAQEPDSTTSQLQLLLKEEDESDEKTQDPEKGLMGSSENSWELTETDPLLDAK